VGSFGRVGLTSSASLGLEGSLGLLVEDEEVAMVGPDGCLASGLNGIAEPAPGAPLESLRLSAECWSEGGGRTATTGFATLDCPCA